MAVRRSKEETFSVKGKTEEWLKKAEQALHKGGFANVKTNLLLNQLTGDYKNLTIWGEIIVTLLPEGENIKINAKSTANADNIYALFSSPNQKILDQFKNNFYNSSIMALIYCPDCGKEVSGSANNCPNCAYPLSKMRNQTQSFPPVYQNNQLIIAGYIAVFLSFFIFPFFFMIIGVVLGIVNLTKGAIGHGVLQIVLSLIFGILGTFLV
jgi:hypothetical protein